MDKDTKRLSSENLKLIQAIINKTVAETVVGIRKAGLMKDGQKSVYRKTESLLYNYKLFKQALEERQQILADGDYNHEKSKSITSYNKYSSKVEPEEREQIKRKELMASIEITGRCISIIDSALAHIKNDPYYKVIGYKYFEGKTHQEIAEIMDKDVSTITRNKTRLINGLKVFMFSDEAIAELFT